MPVFPYTANDFADIAHRVVDDFRTVLGTPAALLPHSPEAAIAAALAGASHALHRHGERVASTALWAVLFSDQYIDFWATRFGVNRKSGDKATGSIELNGTLGTVVPIGTVWRRTADAFEYESTEAVTLTGAAVPVAVRAKVSGVIGNALNTTPLELVGAIAGLVTAADVAGDITNGAEPETTDQLLARLLQRLRYPPKGGGAGDYVRWALENKGVTRAWEAGEVNGQILQQLGYVTVRYVRDGNYDADPTFPTSAADRAKVYAYIKARMPVGIKLVVPSPYDPGIPGTDPAEYQAQPLNPTIKIFPNTDAVQKAAARVLRVALTRARLGPATFPISLLVNALSSEELVQGFEIMAPVGNVAISAYRVLTLGSPTWGNI